MASEYMIKYGTRYPEARPFKLNFHIGRTSPDARRCDLNRPRTMYVIKNTEGFQRVDRTRRQKTAAHLLPGKPIPL
jgi:hypothetical protein